jgi:hypothetical protein
MTATEPPGLDPRRLVRLMADAVERCRLDLTGFSILTEAATGPYIVTPVLAAMAGGTVYALAATTRYAAAGELRSSTQALARMAGVAGRISFSERKDPAIIGRADIVTNSGQVRPVDAEMAGQLKHTCVVPLMYEAWEYRDTDVDIQACRSRGIMVAGTNERHPAVDVFSFLGLMAVKQLHDAGVAVYGSRVLLLCDNAFGPFISQCLAGCGAAVTQARTVSADVVPGGCDAVVVALQPRAGFVLQAGDAAVLAKSAPGAPVVQYWGDVDRAALASAGVGVWPPREPEKGHMAILPSAIGPEPIVRLQAGGLKVGEILARGPGNVTPEERSFISELGARGANVPGPYVVVNSDNPEEA